MELWEPDPSWTPKQAHAFVTYRDLGPERSFAKVVGNDPSKRRQFERWSSDNGWQAKTAAYDSMIAERRTEVTLHENEAIARKHARNLEALIDVLSKPALDLLDDLEGGRVNGNLFDDLTPYERLAIAEKAARVLPSLVQASRLVRGVSTENVEHLHRVRLDRASSEELDELLSGIEGEAVEIE